MGVSGHGLRCSQAADPPAGPGELCWTACAGFAATGCCIGCGARVAARSPSAARLRTASATGCCTRGAAVTAPRLHGGSGGCRWFLYADNGRCHGSDFLGGALHHGGILQPGERCRIHNYHRGRRGLLALLQTGESAGVDGRPGFAASVFCCCAKGTCAGAGAARE